MTDKQIEILREKHPVSYDELCKYNSFEQILGKNSEEYTEIIRKERWRKVLKTLGKNNEWDDVSGCYGCMYLNNKEAWCDLMGLPCTVNPFLSFRYGMVGMACCGTSFIKREPSLFEEEELF